ncbi:hypothetical protein [Desulfosudis oleivorans]|uniref:Uncharacterized protein n=1 Tax=Desulfosudis oleivorans (strain DSM 6200 / JCM 39069 / Hxd3) TaxID=96561 RepID=A8ZYK7_DESOH|nr:hypothetical protein [Desulfosudis oleivorans]ABW68732.1 hypothetical protein Dole_2929 [Desulfosudis oleivorans Hxd3]
MNFSIWDLPGPENFVSGIIDDIRLGRNVFLLLPETTPGGLYEAIKQKLKETITSLERLSAAEISQSSPAYDLHQFYNTKIENENFDIASLCRSENFQSRVIWLENIVGPKEQEWYNFLKQYSVACSNQRLIERSLFVIPIYGQHTRDDLPIENLLTHHWFWGKISSLDLQIFASMMLSPRHDYTLQNRLFLSVIASLCGYDLSAAEKLTRRLEIEENALISELENLATERKWNDSLVQKIWINDFQQMEWDFKSTKPNYTVIKQWAAGMLDKVDGRIMISPVAEIVRGNPGEIRQRIWRGHVQCLLPIIDECRLKVIQYLETNYRPRLSFLINNDQGPLEIGSIKYYIDTNPQIRKRIDRDFHNYIKLLTRIRNDLAHLKPISLTHINRFESGLQALFCKG